MKFSVLMCFLFALILVSSVVIAEDANIEESKRNDFNARLEHINCRIQLTEKQIDLLNIVDSNISSYKTLLDADYVKLQELASTLKPKEFSNYFTTTFKKNLMNAVKAIQAAKRSVIRANLTRDEKTSLRDSNKMMIAEFAECINKADKDFAESRIKYLDAWLNRWNNVISKMKEKGFDTTEMESIVADAENELLPVLEQIRAAEKGAKKIVMENAKSIHLHLWAKFEIARVRSYLKSIESDAIAKGYQSDVDAIKAKLNEASNTAVTGKRYKEGEFETVWKLIRDAAQMLKELNRKLK